MKFCSKQEPKKEGKTDNRKTESGAPTKLPMESKSAFGRGAKVNTRPENQNEWGNNNERRESSDERL